MTDLNQPTKSEEVNPRNLPTLIVAALTLVALTLKAHADEMSVAVAANLHWANGEARARVREGDGPQSVDRPWHGGQALCTEFVATGTAELGFIALSQIYKDGQYANGSYWVMPSTLYPQLRQDAVPLVRGRNNLAAAELLAYLKSDAARQVIRASGHES